MNIEISAFQARNFKPFIDTGWIDIKPITLAFGHNSSGKSALFSILPMLKQTIEDPNRQSPFIFASDVGVDLGSYEEVVHRHQISLSSPIWFNIELSIIPEPKKSFYHSYSRQLIQSLHDLKFNTKKLRLEVAANYNKKQRQVAITECFLKSENKTIFRIYRKTTAATQAWHMQPELLENFEGRIGWNHFIPFLYFPYKNMDDDDKDKIKLQSYTELCFALGQEILENMHNLVHIGPLREFPQRAYRLTGESPKEVGQRGENWLNILLRYKSREELTERINNCLKRLGYSLRIEWGRQGYVHPMLKDKNGLEVSLKDTGFGISQVLPVLVQGFSCSPGTILILEQPEIHLHPQAQAELGDILISIANRGVKLLVETHSEHLLLRLQRRIAESYSIENKIIKPEDVAIYFIESDEGSSKVHNVNLNEKGEFIDSPIKFNTFFSDDYEETIKWSQALAKISKVSE